MACTRDTLGFAMKATYVEVNGKPVVVYKDPKTSDGTKKSAKGLLCVTKDANGNYKLVDNVNPKKETEGYLEPVYIDGKFLVNEKFADLRERLKNA